MMSNNHRSAPVINDYLPIEEASGEYSSDCRKLNKWWQSFSEQRHDQLHYLGNNMPIEESNEHVQNRWMRLICSCYPSSIE